MIWVKVLFFANLREITKAPSACLEMADGATVAELKQQLFVKYPTLKQIDMQKIIVAINKTYASDSSVLPDAAEVAFFPPVSGGSDLTTIIKVTNEPLDISSTLERLIQDETGAICTFTGVVRKETIQGKKQSTMALEYEAYFEMAEEKLFQVAAEIRLRWPCVHGIALIQRIGKLKAGTPSILVAISGSHRSDGVFESARFGIDRIKEIVPVWKKEIGLNNGGQWVQGEYFPEPGE